MLTNKFFLSWLKIREPIILTFLLWHFAGVILWDCPPCPLRDRLVSPFVSYINFFGLWQGWSVFEKPRTYNGYVTANIKFEDSSEKTWDFPRMDKLGMMDRMFKEKYRRWSNDCISDESLSYLWPDAARYIARLYRNQKSPPVSVSIIRHWTWILPPEIGIGIPQPTVDDGQSVLYTAKINAEDLE